MKTLASSPAKVVLEREFLEIRCRILDLAAALDRLDRAEQTSPADAHQLAQINAGIHALLGHSGPSPNRAAEVQLLFSQPYQPEWRKQFEI